MSDLPSIYEALSSSRRRAACQFVAAATDDAVTLEEIATYTTTAEKIEQRGSVADEEHCDQIRAELHHTHLPKLDATGLVLYDSESHVVRPGPKLPAASKLLQSSSERAAESIQRP